MIPMTSHPASALTGEARVPGDKSISHRALMIAGSALGETRISGLLEGADVLATAAAMQALGAEVSRRQQRGDTVWTVRGCGVGGLAEPTGVLDLGNSGTAARLLTGLLATHPFTAFVTGDSSLRSRPMERVMAPLRRIGATFLSRSGGRLPLAVTGTSDPVPIEQTLAVASAQVKSAILLAALNAPGRTTVIEPNATRDHTEVTLRAFGAEVETEKLGGGAVAVTLTGQPEIGGTDVTVPGDFSSAAFPMVAALTVPGSRVTLRRIGVNVLRTGLLRTFAEMGAGIEVEELANGAGEPIADVTVTAGMLKGVEVPPERVPAMIDEFPILAAAAACAEGKTVFAGVGELRVKESDRISAIAEGLKACGVTVAEDDDSLTITGAGGPPPGGGTVEARGDHRIAMAFLVLGLAAKKPVTIDDGTNIDTSFPGFAELMAGFGAKIGGAPA
jgi:3-phosphoshikimate 1-carboxyvinyltransferase